jgi:hypothetical protein
MAACQSSERVPNADWVLPDPSAESCPRKFKRSRSRPELPRFLQQFLQAWSPADGSCVASTDRESEQARNAIVKDWEA